MHLTSTMAVFLKNLIIKINTGCEKPITSGYRHGLSTIEYES